MFELVRKNRIRSAVLVVLMMVLLSVMGFVAGAAPLGVERHRDDHRVVDAAKAAFFDRAPDQRDPAIPLQRP